MVKTQTADGTALETMWESRWPPDPLKRYEISDFIIYKPVGGVAQLGEHLPCKQGVKSSNLSISIRSSAIDDQMYFENCIQKILQLILRLMQDIRGDYPSGNHSKHR